MPAAAFDSALESPPPPWAPRLPPRHSSLRLPPPRSSSNNSGGGGSNYNNHHQGGGRPFYNNNRGSQNNYNNNNFRGYDEYEGKCQICKKTNHIAKECKWRYAEDNSRKKKIAAAANTSYGADSNWYVDSGATDHITHELEKVTMHERYNGHDQVHNADGSGMEISNIGHSIIRSPHRDIHLNNILHCPTSSKNLLSVHRIALDNHVFLEFHPFFFLIKDQVTKQILY